MSEVGIYIIGMYVCIHIKCMRNLIYLYTCAYENAASKSRIFLVFANLDFK